jgi:hypothetical protein
MDEGRKASHVPRFQAIGQSFPLDAPKAGDGPAFEHYYTRLKTNFGKSLRGEAC